MNIGKAGNNQDELGEEERIEWKDETRIQDQKKRIDDFLLSEVNIPKK